MKDDKMFEKCEPAPTYKKPFTPPPTRRDRRAWERATEKQKRRMFAKQYGYIKPNSK